MKMMQIKERAILLRSQGRTFKEIEGLLGVRIPRSTLSGWCKKVRLPATYHERVRKIVLESAQKARQKSIESRQQKRVVLLDNLYRQNIPLAKLIIDKEVAKIALSALYLGEGAKWRGHRGLALGSSDPTIILLYMKLLKICYGISRGQLKCRVSYRADQDIHILERYWSEITGIRPEQFYKTRPDPRTSNKRTLKEEYKGVCVISCKGTLIQLELEQIAKLLAHQEGR